MCGRFTLSTDRDDLQSRFGFINPRDIPLSPRLNRQYPLRDPLRQSLTHWAENNQPCNCEECDQTFLSNWAEEKEIMINTKVSTQIKPMLCKGEEYKLGTRRIQ